MAGSSSAVRMATPGRKRHRAAYRLCASLPRAMAVVASQDGSLRFVMSQLGRVRYFSHWGSLVSQA